MTAFEFEVMNVLDKRLQVLTNRLIGRKFTNRKQFEKEIRKEVEQLNSDRKLDGIYIGWNVGFYGEYHGTRNYWIFCKLLDSVVFFYQLKLDIKKSDVEKVFSDKRDGEFYVTGSFVVRNAFDYIDKNSRKL